mgnify:CR=1 FL=1
MKSIKIILCICFGILVSNTTIMASTSQTNIVVETFSDGSYIESSISFPSTSKALSSSSTKTASKTDSTASATVSTAQYLNGIHMRTINRTIKLTCSKTGKLS